MKNFVFVHIPKCGGTTIRKNLERIYCERLYYDISFKRRMTGGVNKFTEATDVPISRMHRQVESMYKVVLGHFTVNKWKYLGWPFITILRDPVERVISQYSAMNLWERGAKLNEARRRWKGNIRAFADDTSNQITAMAGVDLEAFLFVGIFEMYERSVGRMEEILQIRFLPNVGLHNKTRKKTQVTEEDREYIESVNQEDRELYEEAVRGFHK